MFLKPASIRKYAYRVKMHKKCIIFSTFFHVIPHKMHQTYLSTPPLFYHLTNKSYWKKLTTPDQLHSESCRIKSLPC
jgi:hypothetical protein